MNNSKAKVLFDKNPNYQKHHSTGFWGGITPDGKKLSIEFCEDLPSLPLNLDMVLKENGSISEENVEYDSQVRRIIHGGITVPCELLPDIIKWLQNSYEQFLMIQNNGTIKQ